MDENKKYQKLYLEINLWSCDNYFPEYYYKLINCTHLSFRHIEINDDHKHIFKYLKNCQYLKSRIDDFCQIDQYNLDNLTEIFINSFYVNEKLLKKLTKCQKITIISPHIEDNDLQYFTECKILRLERCENINGSGFQYLNKCKNIALVSIHTLEKQFMHYLADKEIIFLNTTNITDNSISHFKSCQNITLFNCQYITDNCLKFLKHCYEINLRYTKIKGYFFHNLINCIILELSSKYLIEKNLNKLNNLKYLKTLYIDKKFPKVFDELKNISQIFTRNKIDHWS